MRGGQAPSMGMLRHVLINARWPGSLFSAAALCEPARPRFLDQRGVTGYYYKFVAGVVRESRAAPNLDPANLGIILHRARFYFQLKCNPKMLENHCNRLYSFVSVCNHFNYWTPNLSAVTSSFGNFSLHSKMLENDCDRLCSFAIILIIERQTYRQLHRVLEISLWDGSSWPIW